MSADSETPLMVAPGEGGPPEPPPPEAATAAGGEGEPPRPDDFVFEVAPVGGLFRLRLATAEGELKCLAARGDLDSIAEALDVARGTSFHRTFADRLKPSGS